MIEIDGSLGEGGGQVLRSALTLSILTSKPFRITNIRAQRSKPGLMAQHLKAVDAAAAVSRAEVSGAVLYSQEITFIPGQIRSGRYKLEIGTAGATTLVLQTIFLPLSRASSASTIQISGGTHVPWSPSYHYIEQQWLPVLRQMGFEAQLTLEAAGFYPEGNGRITITIRPAQTIQPLHLTERGVLKQLSGMSAVANLDLSIADRQKRQALRRLEGRKLTTRIKTVTLPAPFKGTVLHLLAEFEKGRGCFTGLGKLGKPAEQVADEAVDGLEAYLDSGAAVDPYLADQLLLPLSLADGPSEFTTSQVTPHLVTNAAILEAFAAAQVRVTGDLGQPGLVTVFPAGIIP